MNNPDLPLRANARLRTDDSLRRERDLLDEIAWGCLNPYSESTLRLAQARRETDRQLSGERGQIEEVVAGGTRDLIEEQTARGSADAALVDRDSLLATFGHDLRSLLNVLSLNAELSLKKAGGDPQDMKDVQRTVRRMDSLISNLLDHARLKAGTFHVAFDWRNAAEIIEEAVDIFRPVALARSLSLDASLPGTNLTARIDADRIFQVLSNLFSNAINVTSRGGSILVSAALVDDVVQITVRDSGRGIAETDLGRIFKPYSQLDGAERRGLGLGLFISKSIVQAHGGQIWAESTLGGGSTFYFTVPGLNGAAVGESPPVDRRAPS